MNLYQCQNKAQDEGFNNTKFKIKVPSGEVECFWLDAYMGLLTIPSVDEKGFISTGTLDKMFPDLECYDFKVIGN